MTASITMTAEEFISNMSQVIGIHMHPGGRYGGPDGIRALARMIGLGLADYSDEEYRKARGGIYGQIVIKPTFGTSWFPRVDARDFLKWEDEARQRELQERALAAAEPTSPPRWTGPLAQAPEWVRKAVRAFGGFQQGSVVLYDADPLVAVFTSPAGLVLRLYPRDREMFKVLTWEQVDSLTSADIQLWGRGKFHFVWFGGSYGN